VKSILDTDSIQCRVSLGALKALLIRRGCLPIGRYVPAVGLRRLARYPAPLPQRLQYFTMLAWARQWECY